MKGVLYDSLIFRRHYSTFNAKLFPVKQVSKISDCLQQQCPWWSMLTSDFLSRFTRRSTIVENSHQLTKDLYQVLIPMVLCASIALTAILTSSFPCYVEKHDAGNRKANQFERTSAEPKQPPSQPAYSKEPAEYLKPVKTSDTKTTELQDFSRRAQERGRYDG